MATLSPEMTNNDKTKSHKYDNVSYAQNTNSLDIYFQGGSVFT